MSFRSSALGILAAATLQGCAGGQGSSTSAATPATLDGEALLQRTCTVCHDLGGLPPFADYWGEPEWGSMVETMMDYGARLTPEEVPVLVRYLAVNYGTAGK
jgi:cytochrome c5